MLKLLIKNPLNRKLKKNEKLQIGFDKKLKIEMIFDNGANDIYYIPDKEKKEKKHNKTGSLFLDYLADDVTEIFSNFFDDVIEENNIKNIEDKYINAYTFYFKYFFEDKWKQDGLKSMKNIEKEEIPEVKEFCIRVLQKFENAENLKELVALKKEYIGNVYKRNEEIFIGNMFFKKGDKFAYKVNGSRYKNILDFFVDKVYLQKVYKLLIDYCYFRIDTINSQLNSRNVIQRFLLFRYEYDKLFGFGTEREAQILHFDIPEATANITKSGEIVYCYQIDEFTVKDLSNKGHTEESLGIEQFKITNRFFNLSLLELLECGNRISICENCNRYFILNKEGTIYCNNPSPQNGNRTCSSYMKEYNYKNKLNRDKEKKEINRAIKKARDRIYRYWKPLLDTNENRERNLVKSEKDKKEWKESLKKKEKEYKKGNITLTEFVDWLDKSNRKR